jgi:hypothetical protein
VYSVSFGRIRRTTGRAHDNGIEQASVARNQRSAGVKKTWHIFAASQFNRINDFRFR